MTSRASALLAAAAVAVFAGSGLAYLPAGYALRYATVAFGGRPGTALALPLALLAAFAHEAAVRGALYGAVRGRLPAGFAAVAVSLAGCLAPLAARLVLLPVPSVPAWLVAGQGFFVELPLSFGLTWMALGTGRWTAGAAALALLWAGRLLLVPTYHGASLPLLEVVAAAVAAAAVAAVLHRPLAPHREALEGLS